MTFDPTNARDLELVIRNELEQNITPTLEAGKTWTHGDNPQPGAVSDNLREFFLQWTGDAKLEVGGATGNLDFEVTATLAVITHYHALEPDQVGEVVITDHFDINRHFLDRLHTLFGLTMWEPLGSDVLDEDGRIYVHLYDVRYMRR